MNLNSHYNKIYICCFLKLPDEKELDIPLLIELREARGKCMGKGECNKADLVLNILFKCLLM